LLVKNHYPLEQLLYSQLVGCGPKVSCRYVLGRLCTDSSLYYSLVTVYIYFQKI